MGTCCCGTKPAEKFVGTWTDGDQVSLMINKSGNIDYRKLSENTRVSLTGPSRFKDDQLFYCCCCCVLRATYTERPNSQPEILTNGIVLTKKP